MVDLTREEVLAHRISVQQLDRPRADRPLTDAAVLDLGVQDTGRDGASWALANRGVPVPGPQAVVASNDLALVWSLRVSPHYYRRSELPDVLVAVSPFSDADADKRIVGAGQPLRTAGIPTRQGIGEVARQMRELVCEPAVKGDVSTRLSAVLDAPYLRDCVPCGAVHVWESTFRLGALYGGLELEPGTSPPVLRRIPDWPERALDPAVDPLAAPRHLQVIRNYLRFLGPATPSEVAGFLDAPTAEVKAHWPDDAVEVVVEGKKRWWLAGDSAPAVEGDLVRLLGPFDLLLQGRDRQVLVPDASRHKALWPTLGRPGAVLSGTSIVGVWRPKAAGRTFALRLDPWVPLAPRVKSRIEQEAATLAAHRGLSFAGVVSD